MIEGVRSSKMYFSPLLQRRSVTSYGEFPSIPPVRSRSARYTSASVTMPRTHVSVARFYDWSEDLGDCVSVSRLYRDLANLPKMGDRGKGKGTQWCTNGIRVTPGRMFSREKGALTKGEREIIEGIYKNRGENARDVYRNDSPLKSHHEAWLVGKTIPKVKQDQRQTTMKNEDSEFRVPDTLFLKSSSISEESHPNSKEHCATCYFCTKDKNGQKHGKSDESANHYKNGADWSEDIPLAPPSTPDRLLEKRTRPQGQGYSSHDSSFSGDSPESSYLDSPRKVRVNVYLPAMAADHTEDDIRSCLLHGQSLLRKERPLTQSDFKRLPERGSEFRANSRTSTPRERMSNHSSPRSDSKGSGGSVTVDKAKPLSVKNNLEMSE